MPDDTSAPHSDDLHLPWIFVPHGAPEPTEWMAEHPGWIKIPATMVPRGSGNRGLGRRSTSLPPVTLGTTATGLAAPGLIGSGAEGGVATLGEILAGAAAPLAALGILLYPSRTAPPEMDEASPELRRTLGKPPTEALTPPPPSAPLPGLVPPATNQQSSEGFTPSPPTPALPGSIPAASPPPILPGHIAAELSPIILPKERNEGLVGGARTNSPRARKAAEAADPAVTKALKEADWRAHHLINLAGIRQVADLIAEAERAGWKTDDSSNVAPLPGTRAAQEKLAKGGIDRPLHDNGHPNWNADVNNGLRRIERGLASRNLQPNTPAYGKAAKDALEQLQDELRKKTLKLRRLTQNDDIETAVPV